MRAATMDISEKKKYEEEGRQIASCIETGDIDTLRQILPTAEDLVKATENCIDHNHDIMNQIASTGNHEMFDKIIQAYFSDRSAENDALRRRFLLSHQKLYGRPKDFHYFARHGVEPLIARKEYFLDPNNMTSSEASEKYISTLDAYNSPTEDKEEQKKHNQYQLYEKIRDSYTEACPKTNPHEPMPNSRSEITPKGEASVEKSLMPQFGNKNRAAEKICLITYPKIRVADMEQMEQSNGSILCPCIDITKAKFTEDQNDLAEQAFNSMHFPDAVSIHTYSYLRQLGETYQKIHDDGPLGDAVVHNFNQNGRFYVLENAKDPTFKGNSNDGVDYTGYSSTDYICLRTDYGYNEGTVLHEGTHDTDKGKFCNTDLYTFVATIMCTNPSKSEERSYAVNKTLANYPCSQFEVETLARIPEQYFSSQQYADDPLLGATYKIFSAYGNAKLNEDQGIIDRINNCMRLRLNGNVGYEKFAHINDLRLDYFAQVDERNESKKNASPENYTPTISKEELRQKADELMNKYTSMGSSEQLPQTSKKQACETIENEFVKCIEAELKAIEKIKQYPLAAKISLDIDTLSRDNITEDVPLEILVAKSIEPKEKIASLRAKKLTPAELVESAKEAITAGKSELEELEADKKDGWSLNRHLYCSLIEHTVETRQYTNELISLYWPDYQPYNKETVHDYYKTSEAILKNASSVLENIQLINHKDMEKRIPASLICYPHITSKRKIEEGERKFEQYSSITNTEERIKFLQDIKGYQGIRDCTFMQRLYKEFYPESKIVPQDLYYTSINSSGKMESCKKYCDMFIKQLKASQSPTQTPKQAERL